MNAYKPNETTKKAIEAGHPDTILLHRFSSNGYVIEFSISGAYVANESGKVLLKKGSHSKFMPKTSREADLLKYHRKLVLGILTGLMN